MLNKSFSVHVLWCVVLCCICPWSMLMKADRVCALGHVMEVCLCPCSLTCWRNLFLCALQHGIEMCSCTLLDNSEAYNYLCRTACEWAIFLWVPCSTLKTFVCIHALRHLNNICLSPCHDTSEESIYIFSRGRANIVSLFCALCPVPCSMLMRSVCMCVLQHAFALCRVFMKHEPCDCTLQNRSWSTLMLIVVSS
jgi:hypothetical protein